MNLKPIEVINKQRIDQEFFEDTESLFSNPHFSNLGGNTIPLDGIKAKADWFLANKTVYAAGSENTWRRVDFGTITPNCGRKIKSQRGKKLTWYNTDPGQVCAIITPDIRAAFTIAGGSLNTSIPMNLPHAIGIQVKLVELHRGVPGVDAVVFYKAEFDNIVVKSGYRLDWYFCSPGLTSTNWMVDWPMADSCNDENYDYPLLFEVGGDSLGGQTTDPGALQLCVRDDGSMTGSWPFILKEKLKGDGIFARQVNMAIAGSDSQQWDFLVNQGLTSIRRPDLYIDSLGMNDFSTDSLLSTVVGVDGRYKIGMKNKISSYFRSNPQGSYVLLKVPQTNSVPQNVLVAAGRHAGIKRIDAGRIEQVELVQELKDKYGWDLHLSATDTAYGVNDVPSPYIASEVTSGVKVHDNTQVGHPARAQIIYNTVKLTNFWKNNKPK